MADLRLGLVGVLGALLLLFLNPAEKILGADTSGVKSLYESSVFKIYENSVIQAGSSVTAKSDSELSSGISWRLSKDISGYPAYKSDQVLVNALYNRALEELTQDMLPDGTFMAGAKWTGVWTRDISYSIILSLAIVAPDISKASLMAKVKDGMIIQDTGTGGAWPVSSDRMIWAVAAWEIFKVTGDKKWLADSYKIIKKSALSDMNVLFDPYTGLMRGESSFLDWREQTYPKWMDPKDIFSSANLGTNAVHYRAYRILSEMSRLLGENPDPYIGRAERIKTSMNKYLWMPDKGYYGQYLYGRHFMSLSPRSEALGEALSVLFEVADKSARRKILENTPVTEFGIPCIYPQIPGIEPYHNDAVWPFVCSYWAWASAKAMNYKAAEEAFASIYRASALFGTDKENMVASTGDCKGTAINSDRQLWSVAGNLALTYRVIFGMSFYPDRLVLRPLIPKAYGGRRCLNNFRYREASLSINISGYGNRIKSMLLDGSELKKGFIPGGIKGRHNIDIVMANEIGTEGNLHLLRNAYSPETPVLRLENRTLKWNRIKGAIEYDIYANGIKEASVSDTAYRLKNIRGYSVFQVLAKDTEGLESFLTEPIQSGASARIIEIEDFNPGFSREVSGYSGKGYVRLTKENSVTFEANLNESGDYLIDFRYANGNGPINTSNKCALRTLYLNGTSAGSLVFPQRGEGQWQDWGYSNPIKLRLNKGINKLSILFLESDNNMNLDVNTAFVDEARLFLLQ